MEYVFFHPRSEAVLFSINAPYEHTKMHVVDWFGVLSIVCFMKLAHDFTVVVFLCFFCCYVINSSMWYITISFRVALLAKAIIDSPHANEGNPGDMENIYRYQNTTNHKVCRTQTRCHCCNKKFLQQMAGWKSSTVGLHWKVMVVWHHVGWIYGSLALYSDILESHAS